MKTVIIIGCGAAGIAAATKLIENGIDLNCITLLEAQNRIGGRIHTIVEGNKFKSSALEMGAQWVHGVEGNIVHSLASAAGELHTEINTLESSGLADDVSFSFNDSTLTTKQRAEFFEVIDAIRENESEKLRDYDKSYGEFLTESFQYKVDGGVFKTIDNSTAYALFDWFHLMSNIIDGSDNWTETSGSGHTYYNECQGDPLVTWKRGYSSLFDILTKNLPKSKNGLGLPLSDRILLGKAVQRVDWSCEMEGVHITCADGTTYESDFVLVTCSLGFLKENINELFVPRLPHSKRNAIEALGFGTVDKLYLKFEKPWWNSNWGGVNFLSHSAEQPSPKEWVQHILGFHTVRNHPNLLVGWITGAAAREAENLPEIQVLETCSQRLRNHLNSDVLYTEPIALIRSLWHSNAYTRGSYSYRSMQSQKADVWARDLAEPLRDSNGQLRLFFAGEATHDHFYSTVHGAVETGFREAERITEIINSAH